MLHLLGAAFGSARVLSGVQPMPAMPPFSTVRSPIGGGRRDSSHSDRRAALQHNVEAGQTRSWQAVTTQAAYPSLADITEPRGETSAGR
jgi:hypothetical protein